MDLPDDVARIIDEIVRPKERAMLSVCCKRLRRIHLAKCARHTSFQHAKKIMATLIVEKHSRQHTSGSNVTAFVMKPDCFMRWCFNFDSRVHRYSFIQSPKFRKLLYSNQRSCFLQYKGSTVRVYMHPAPTPTPYTLLKDYCEAHFPGGSGIIPIAAWKLYVKECLRLGFPHRDEFESFH